MCYGRRFFFFSSRRRHTRSYGDWSTDVCSSDLVAIGQHYLGVGADVDQHPHAAGPIHVDGDEVGGDVGADMAGDEWGAHHPALGMHPEAEPMRTLDERSALALAGQELELG